MGGDFASARIPLMPFGIISCRFIAIPARRMPAVRIRARYQAPFWSVPQAAPYRRNAGSSIAAPPAQISFHSPRHIVDSQRPRRCRRYDSDAALDARRSGEGSAAIRQPFIAALPPGRSAISRARLLCHAAAATSPTVLLLTLTGQRRRHRAEQARSSPLLPRAASDKVSDSAMFCAGLPDIGLA